MSLSKSQQSTTSYSYYSFLVLGVGLLTISISCLAISLLNLQKFTRAFSLVLLSGSLTLLFFSTLLIVWSYMALSNPDEDSTITASPGELDQRELVQDFKDHLEMQKRNEATLENNLIEERLSRRKLESTIGLWEERTLEMFRLMERTLANEDLLDEGYRRAVNDLQRRYTKLLHPLGFIPIIPKKDDMFDPKLHIAKASRPSGEVAPGQIITCVSWGYMVSGEIRSLAEVIVADN